MDINDWFQIIMPLAIIQTLLSFWIKSRIELSIKNEYDRQLEDYRFSLLQKEYSIKLAELLTRWIEFDQNDYDSMAEDFKMDLNRTLNKLSMEIFLWIPDEKLIKEIMGRLANKKDSLSVRQLIFELRKIMHNKDAKILKADDLTLWK